MEEEKELNDIKDLNADDDGSFDEVFTPKIKKYDISAYPADYTISTICEKYDKSIIVPEFQRQFVWGKDIEKQSRLIESFLLGLPVPQIFLFQKKDNKNLLIIDGFQRLNTIKRFTENAFKLKNVQSDLLGKGYDDLSLEDKEFFDNSTLRAIIIRQITPDDNYTSMYQIFERLNTGGIVLSPMEIRKAISYGKFYKTLEFLNNDDNWKKIINRGEPEYRLRDIEWILRIFSFYQNGFMHYYEPLKDYLNHSMLKNKNDEHKEFESKFIETCDYIVSSIGEKPFHKISGRLNLAILDSVFTTILKKGKIHNLNLKYQELLKDKNYLDSVASRVATTHGNVYNRFALAEKYLL